MNNWLKIGLPILLAVLLVVTAVSLTLVITNSGMQGVAHQGAPAGTQYVSGPYCYGWRTPAANQNGATYGYGPGRCFGWCWN